MKNLISFLSASMIALACSLTIQSCEDKKTAESHDSAEVAEKENDKKFETNESEKNADLVAKSVEYNYAVIELAKLAETKAVRKDVKEIAKEIKKGHEESLAELKVVAEKEGISIASGPSDKAEDKVEELAEKDADKFDKKWVNKLIEKHKKSIDELEDALNNDKIHGLEKEWANKSLPALRAHLEKLKAIDEAIKN
jgi:putative membrane protein